MTDNQTYLGSGVDVAAGDSASRILFEAARSTWGNRLGKVGEIRFASDNFRGCRYFLPDANISGSICLGLNFDGIGTKVEIAERLHSYGSLAYDLLAMTCDDASVQGAEPVQFGSIIDAAKVDIEVIRDLAGGLVRAAKDAGVAVINGELAELPGRVRGFSSTAFNWGGTCLWAAKKETLEAWGQPLPGDVVIGVTENGFRSNGYSLIRAVFRGAYGEHWGLGASPEGGDLIRFASRPSIIYTPFILSLTGGLNGNFLTGMKAIIHVTGGGLLGRCRHFSTTYGIGVHLFGLPQPPEEMCQIRELGNIEIEEAYSAWNMGLGLLIASCEESAPKILESAASFGFKADVVGEITPETEVRLRTYVGTEIRRE